MENAPVPFASFRIFAVVAVVAAQLCFACGVATAIAAAAAACEAAGAAAAAGVVETRDVVVVVVVVAAAATSGGRRRPVGDIEALPLSRLEADRIHFRFLVSVLEKWCREGGPRLLLLLRRLRGSGDVVDGRGSFGLEQLALLIEVFVADPSSRGRVETFNL